MDFFKTHFARIFYINQSVSGAFIIYLNIVVMCSKLTVRTPEWHQMTFLNVFLVYLLYNIKTFNISKHQTIALNIFKSWHQNDLIWHCIVELFFVVVCLFFCFFFDLDMKRFIMHALENIHADHYCFHFCRSLFEAYSFL